MPVLGQPAQSADDQYLAILSNPVEPDVPERAGKFLCAFQISENAPVIDGHLDEEV